MSDEAAPTTPAAANDAPRPSFRIDNISVKNISLEIPENLVAPDFGAAPHLNLEIRNTQRELSQSGSFEAALEITARVKNGDKTQLLIEITQAGVFRIDNANADTRRFLLTVAAPEMLYPYAAQMIGDLLQKAGGPRLFLPPFNFRELYEKKRALLKKAADHPPPTKQ